METPTHLRVVDHQPFHFTVEDDLIRFILKEDVMRLQVNNNRCAIGEVCPINCPGSGTNALLV